MISREIITAAPPLTASAADQFRADVLAGLAAPRKRLPCKYFYDEVGSELFERICALPEYYLTRAELEILLRHAPEMAGLLGANCLLVEYGSGSGRKTRLLLKHVNMRAAYVPIDVAGAQLRSAARALARDYPHIEVHPLCADFTQPIRLPAIGTPCQRRVVFFPGSTVGNFTPSEALRLLRQTAEFCGPGGGLLLGADLKKDPRIIAAAYNDEQGVTAAFNLNLLERVNRQLGADLRVEDFWHHAFYDPRAGRIEMHLVSRRDQHVRVSGREFFLAEGESVCTEYSYKYSLGELRGLAEAAGFSVERVWLDEHRYFSVHYFAVRDGGHNGHSGA